MENEKKVSFQLLVLIATPKLADRAAEMFRKGALPLQYRFHAEGTATSEIMDVLGLGNIDKSVLISMIPKNLSEILLNKLNSELQLNRANSGIAFTMPLSGANNLILRILARNTGKELLNIAGKEENSMSETNILCCSNRKQRFQRRSYGSSACARSKRRHCNSQPTYRKQRSNQFLGTQRSG